MPGPIVLLSIEAEFAKRAMFFIWGEDWLIKWAKRTQYTDEGLCQRLSDDHLHPEQEPRLDEMVRVQIELELRRLHMTLAFNEAETEQIEASSDKQARGLPELYADGIAMRKSRERLQRMLAELDRRSEYHTWVARHGDPDERNV